MPYDLYSQSTLCRTFSRQFLAKALELAMLYGWKPMGTCSPCRGIDWLGTYLTNDGQTVRAEDALALAIALERSLKHIPDANPKIDWDPKLWIEDDLPEWLSPDEKALIEEEMQDGLLDILGKNPLEFFAGDEKHTLMQFIRFCRLGSFEIL